MTLPPRWDGTTPLTPAAAKHVDLHQSLQSKSDVFGSLFKRFPEPENARSEQNKGD